MQYLDLIASAAVIGLAIFAISTLFALGLGVTLGRVAKAADDDMFAHYLAAKWADDLGLDGGDDDPDPYDGAARRWIADAREAA